MSADDIIRTIFPMLQTTGHRITSQDTDDYNCIAWAAGETHRRWEHNDPWYWPDGVPRVHTVPAYVAAYETRGFAECENGEFEHGYEKIAIYAVQGKPQHAARQLGSGMWTSKLGNLWDIEHPTLDGVENNDYGKPVAFMKRSIILRAGIS
jgi:hypothetical protein